MATATEPHAPLSKVDFGKWLRDFGFCFPDFSAYMGRLPNKDETISKWYESLRCLPYEVLGSVTIRMQNHALAPLEAHEYGLFAHHIWCYGRKIFDDILKAKARAKGSVPSNDPDDRSNTRGAFASVSGSELMVAAKAALRVCRERNIGDGSFFDDAMDVVHAVVVLGDNPKEGERQKAQELLEHFGLTLKELEPLAEDYRGGPLQKAPQEDDNEPSDLSKQLYQEVVL